MDDNQIDDLKQFIAVTISNSVSDIVAESEKRLHKALARDLKSGFSGVGDAIETLSQHIDKLLDDHEARITSLEQAA